MSGHNRIEHIFYYYYFAFLPPHFFFKKMVPGTNQPILAEVEHHFKRKRLTLLRKYMSKCAEIH